MTTLDPLLRAVAAAPAVRRVAAILARLRERGLREPAVASGFIRTHLLGVPPTDVDVHYVGDVPTAVAEGWLAEVLAEAQLSERDWDIWNFTEHDPRITSTEFGYRAHFVSTIDCVYLGADRALHDLTGRGVADARTRTLELCHLDVTEYAFSVGQLCYSYLEGCRRMFLYGLRPTSRSAEALRANAPLWQQCPAVDRAYLVRRLHNKLTAAQRVAAQPLYASFGWGEIFTMRLPDGD
jgi:hypothetical protein